MASWFLTLVSILLLQLPVESISSTVTATATTRRCYKRVYSFGDSIADTGNAYYDTSRLPSPSQQLPASFNPPYGETYFHHPTGRWSNGRLIIDFIAEQMGIPLVKPYLGIKSGQIKDWNPIIIEGLNFAVGGASALDSSFFIEKGMIVKTNLTLRVQLDWFMDLLPSLSN